MYDGLMDSDAASFFKMRPIGVRWRDEATLARIAYNYTERADYGRMTMMPVVTERPRTHLVRVPGQLVPTTSTAPPAPSHDDPSLEDLELIDVLWRSDIAAEKGTRQLEPAEQYERDLQLLTEKSVHAPLSAEESSRFEDLSKVYFEDFYAAPYVLRPGAKGPPQPDSRSEQVFEFEDDQSNKREVRTPTDEDLADLLADVSKEGGQLDQLTCGGVCPPSDLEPLPLVNNVSLSEGIVFTPQNVSEMSMMQEQRQAALASVMAPPAPATLYNDTTVPSMWVQQAEMTPSDIYPNNGYMSFHNDTGVQVISTGSQYDHQYLNNVPGDQRGESSTSRTVPVYDPYYSARTTSFSNESSSVCSSSSTAASPHYHSESENYSPHASRANGDNGVGTVPNVPSMPRRRGRQSKDEQLAAANRLPLSAREISEMTLGELHKVLKNEDLTEYQKQLIRKIRRRGKNKVAARTCRERRGERQRTMRDTETSWSVTVRAHLVLVTS
ncbi:hypothetical protein ANCCEY_03635 [Ancylostoma ceylanicum]|uniref:BZIP domain-containing protein n=1 Tax=Ancylostoma ceylanicum TaxID=53326 RepID=A0A0D6LZL8_9BILA|nr:hypothetical protein ANCCEY_03635 [Ancylostoma ceylanicum]